MREDGTFLYMYVWQEDPIWFAVVFRGLISVDLDLVFGEEGYTFDVRLRAGTTEVELTDLANAAD